MKISRFIDEYCPLFVSLGGGIGFLSIYILPDWYTPLVLILPLLFVYLSCICTHRARYFLLFSYSTMGAVIGVGISFLLIHSFFIWNILHPLLGFMLNLLSFMLIPAFLAFLFHKVDLANETKE